jgi:hypothetical protein
MNFCSFAQQIVNRKPTGRAPCAVLLLFAEAVLTSVVFFGSMC